jgi:hypothetical protein
MTTDKKSDCVKMKRDIQQEIAEESLGIPDEQMHKIQMQKVMKNPILGPFCKKLHRASETVKE